MNTSKKYLKEISYRPARCCGTCKFIDVHGQGVLYCNRHDNPVSKTSVCKFWQRGDQSGADLLPCGHSKDNQSWNLPEGVGYCTACSVSHPLMQAVSKYKDTDPIELVRDVYDIMRDGDGLSPEKLVADVVEMLREYLSCH